MDTQQETQPQALSQSPLGSQAIPEQFADKANKATGISGEWKLDQEYKIASGGEVLSHSYYIGNIGNPPEKVMIELELFNKEGSAGNKDINLTVYGSSSGYSYFYNSKSSIAQLTGQSAWSLMNSNPTADNAFIVGGTVTLNCKPTYGTVYVTSSLACPINATSVENKFMYGTYSSSEYVNVITITSLQKVTGKIKFYIK